MNYSIIIIVLLCLLLAVTSYYMLKFALILIDIEDKLSKSINQIEDSYEVFNDISKKPVFFDSIEVRQCIQEIVITKELLFEIIEDMKNISNIELKSESKEENESREEKNS